MKVFYSTRFGEKNALDIDVNNTVERLRRDILAKEISREGVILPIDKMQLENLDLFIGSWKMDSRNQLSSYNVSEGTVVHPVWINKGTGYKLDLDNIATLIGMGAVTDPDWWVETSIQAGDNAKKGLETVRQRCDLLARNVQRKMSWWKENASSAQEDAPQHEHEVQRAVM